MNETIVIAAVTLLGTLIYTLSKDGKAAEIGRIMLWVGLLVFLLRLGGTVRF